MVMAGIRAFFKRVTNDDWTFAQAFRAGSTHEI